ncbi:hypothetical protein GOP47_0008540 [Adiantum capillus-veneris]|uniref:Fe2OG dioxygenase domain-containing protein n=1 Tax=Adiantum capillus-veneris TaxID=13818 RepID=A0A9D4UZ65_ADICA|nr:hypothetical protein GOP47_0008540 [Adiantum capillus-veneris]
MGGHLHHFKHSHGVFRVKERSYRRNKATLSPFCCGWSFQPLQPIRLAFKDKAGGVGAEMCYMELPTQDDGIVGKLVAACTEASFGKGTETMFDPTYRRSLKLEPKDFLTSFELHSSQILEDIKRVLVPNTDSITAQLYKLNVYRQGDFFKPHVDTPRLNAFASLVLSLPMAFTGGELVVEHKGHAHCFDWSRSNVDGITMLHWAAFYSDCKDEVKELTSGCRIVLTYNLYLNEGKTDGDDNET